MREPRGLDLGPFPDRAIELRPGEVAALDHHWAEVTRIVVLQEGGENQSFAAAGPVTSSSSSASPPEAQASQRLAVGFGGEAVVGAQMRCEGHLGEAKKIPLPKPLNGPSSR